MFLTSMLLSADKTTFFCWNN